MVKLVSLADSITLVNAGLGFLAIFLSFSGELHGAFSLILLAMLADGLDGIVARKTGFGKLGEYMEAMADMISLCVAPSVFVYILYREFVLSSVYLQGLLMMVLILFLSLGMIRLSSFHILKEKKWFVGLPASAGTIVILTLGFLGVDFFIILVVIIGISVAMVLPIRFPKPGHLIYGGAAVLILVSILVGNNFQGVALIVLLVGVLAYVVGGPLYAYKKFVKEK
jgi:CDP-diacylglycerol--serine O-phosphatidyltransferase